MSYEWWKRSIRCMCVQRTQRRNFAEWQLLSNLGTSHALVHDKCESRLSFCACLDTRIVYISHWVRRVHDKNRFRAINTKQHKTEAQKALCACTGLSQRLGRHSIPTCRRSVSYFRTHSRLFTVYCCCLKHKFVDTGASLIVAKFHVWNTWNIPMLVQI